MWYGDPMTSTTTPNERLRQTPGFTELCGRVVVERLTRSTVVGTRKGRVQSVRGTPGPAELELKALLKSVGL